MRVFLIKKIKIIAYATTKSESSIIIIAYATTKSESLGQFLSLNEGASQAIAIPSFHTSNAKP